jgi:hypothetical protein
MATFLQGLNPNSPLFQGLLIALAIWTIPWKALALWHASKNSEKIWFLAVMIVNTFGILEILYLFVFAKQKLTKEKFKSYIKFK